MKEKAFTLIELLVVIAIIALLASLASLSWGKAKKKVRDGRRKADLRQIVFAMKFCYADPNCGGFDQYCQTPAGVNTVQKIGGPAKCNDQGGTTYAFIPKDPLDKGDFRYQWIDNKSDKGKFCVFVHSELENKWFAASQKGVCFSLKSKPTTLDCWNKCPLQ